MRGINADTKRKAVFDWLKGQEAQIIYLQETYRPPYRPLSITKTRHTNSCG